ncbi:MAG: motility protein A [Sphingomonadales bacterium]
MIERLNIDLATTLGLTAGFALIISAMVLGGSPAAFFDLSALLIVVGGTLAVTAVSFSTQEIFATQKTIWRALVNGHGDLQSAADTVLRLAEKARKDGALSLQTVARVYDKQPFLQRALRLVVDGTSVDEIDRILQNEIKSAATRHIRSARVLRRAAEVAPAMGLIGTLVGLVQMLGNLDNPATIGPSMAVALLTTFYGAVLANMVFMPLATKLERNSDEESMINTVFTLGAASIGRRENPRRLEMLLNTLLPPAKRISHFG